MERIVYSKLSHINSIMYCKQRPAACVFSASLREAQHLILHSTGREGYQYYLIREKRHVGQAEPPLNLPDLTV